ncbi:hypothetical protein [Nodularia sp. NIES-3585]|uniref:hypothetical protein n=1 Tax=Nodularia sp. NIES-3585 TaxID=1973477 RepID=UPI000B5CF441|nr:hypothetical protein [Nodularia sp. NIES-3585]GAX36412.1 hypothetical protein NIES3585_24430 [Nodularia sp. NIES-3585]
MNQRETLETQTVNIKLINTLIQVIRALSPEERQILARELFFEGSEPSNQELIKLAETGGCFYFLANEPDIYTCEDGEPV